MKTETAATATLIGGEMLVWSDGDPAPARTGDSETADPATGAALALLVERAVPVGARVLLAGPFDQALLDMLIARGAQVTCLARSYPDAAELARLNTGRTMVDVVAGSLLRLPAGDGFDAVVALGGLDRLCSVEAVELSWDDVHQLLLAALRPGGVLLLSLENPLGLHRLVELTPWYADRSAGAWRLAGRADTDRPVHTDQLRARLAAAGLHVDAVYAAFPSPRQPTALIDTRALAGSPAQVGLLEAVLHRACAHRPPDAVLLRDPWPMAAAALHAGTASALAPAWLVCARRPVARISAELHGGTVAGQPLPVAIVAGDELTEVDADASAAGEWLLRAPARPAAPGRPVPAGRLLRELLVDGCLRRDVPQLRRLLSGYANWLAGHADVENRLSATYGPATPDNVVTDGDSYTMLDLDLKLGDPMALDRMTLDATLARGLRGFAVELVRARYVHPWPSTVDIDGLTVILGGLAGRALEPAVHRLALDEWEHAEVPTAGSYQQLRLAWAAQQDELTRLRARLAWSEEILNSRETSLKRTQLALGLLSGSVSYRVGRLLITPLRLVKRGVGKVRRKLRRSVEEQQ